MEFKQENNEFIAPTMKTLDDLMAEYMSIYGVNTWAISTYEGRKALISNYISPIIGDMKLEDITPRIMDKYYRDLLSVKSVVSNNVRPKNEFVSPHIVREIHKLLRNAFNQAVKWELMTRNPVEHATLPKEEHTLREIWTADVLFKALDLCENNDLKLGMNLAFSCTLRMGELLGLTWDCVDISQTSIENGQAFIFINKELQRVNRDSMETLGDKGVIRRFPPAIRSTNTALVLKEPKTKTYEAASEAGNGGSFKDAGRKFMRQHRYIRLYMWKSFSMLISRGQNTHRGICECSALSFCVLV